MFKRKKEKQQEKKNVWTILGIESKKVRWGIRLLFVFFMMFMFSAIGHSLSGNDVTAIVMWCLCGVFACATLGTLIFKSNFN